MPEAGSPLDFFNILSFSLGPLCVRLVAVMPKRFNGHADHKRRTHRVPWKASFVVPCNTNWFHSPPRCETDSLPFISMSSTTATLAPILVSWCCCNKLPCQWLKITQICCLTITELRSLTQPQRAKIKVFTGLHSFRRLQGEHTPCSFQFLEAM